jgi:hypothetical protein
VRQGADADAVERAIAALRTPGHQVTSVVIDLGDRTVSVCHPGSGHTDHDLIASASCADRAVLSCGDPSRSLAIQAWTRILIRWPGLRL